MFAWRQRLECDKNISYAFAFLIFDFQKDIEADDGEERNYESKNDIALAIKYIA